MKKPTAWQFEEKMNPQITPLSHQLAKFQGKTLDESANLLKNSLVVTKNNKQIKF